MPANTPRGFPYPLPTEPVAEGAQAIRNLAEAIDAKAGLQLIQTITLASPGTFIFQNIPQTYSHLRVEAFARESGTGGLVALGLRLNADAGNTHEWVCATTAGSTPPTNYNSGGGTSWWRFGTLYPGIPEAIAAVADIPGYRSAAYRKTYVYQAGGWAAGPGLYVEHGGGRYYGTLGAVTRLDVFAVAGNPLDVGSICSLYGLP